MFSATRQWSSGLLNSTLAQVDQVQVKNEAKVARWANLHEFIRYLIFLDDHQHHKTSGYTLSLWTTVGSQIPLTSLYINNNIIGSRTGTISHVSHGAWLQIHGNGMALHCIIKVYAAWTDWHGEALLAFDFFVGGCEWDDGMAWNAIGPRVSKFEFKMRV